MAYYTLFFSMLKVTKKAYFHKHFEEFFSIADSYDCVKKLYASFCSNASLLSLIYKLLVFDS